MHELYRGYDIIPTQLNADWPPPFRGTLVYQVRHARTGEQLGIYTSIEMARGQISTHLDSEMPGTIYLR